MSDQREDVMGVASELGIRSDMLRRWKKEHSEDKERAFIGGGNAKRKKVPNELSMLKKQLREAELERDILKKAVGIFSKSERLDISL